jgi:membrane-anchored mycosin MYCP
VRSTGAAALVAVALAASMPAVPAAAPARLAVASTVSAPPGAGPGLPVRCPAPAARAAGERVGPSAAERLRLAAAHSLATGRGQRVAVIDTGVAPHPRLAGRLVGLGDFLGDGDGLDDCDGHGTAVAGLIGAAPDPGDGLVGVAPDAQILALRQFSPSATGAVGHPTGDLPSLAAALIRAVRQGATVVNISGAVCVPAARAAAVGAPLRAALDVAARADVVVVAAAGNVDGGGCADRDPDQVSLPGWFGDDLLTVGAVGPDDRPATFTVPGPWVDVAAPGTDVRSLTVDGGTGGPLDGTSFAAPYVAGLAALIRERRPELTARQVAHRIIATARRPATDRDEAVGAGVVDLVAALTAEPAVLRVGDRVPPVATASLARSAPAPAAPAWPIAALAALLVAAGAALASPRSGGPGHGRR